MKLWPIFLGLWLVVHGLMAVIDLSFRHDDLVMGIGAIVAGVLVMIRQ